MPEIKKLSPEEILKILEKPKHKEDIKEIIKLLNMVHATYISKIGTYLPGAFKSINERKVRRAADNTLKLIEFYSRTGYLSEKQIIWAKKMIRNGLKLG